MAWVELRVEAHFHYKKLFKLLFLSFFKADLQNNDIKQAFTIDQNSRVPHFHNVKAFWETVPGVYKEMSSILADQIAPSCMSPDAGGGGELRGLSQWVQLYKGAQRNSRDLTFGQYNHSRKDDI